MGKRRKRLTMAKYANKYRAIREALFGKKEEENIVVEEPTPEPEVVAEAVEAPVVEKPKPKPRKPRKKATATAKKATAKKATAKKRTTKKKAAAAK